MAGLKWEIEMIKRLRSSSISTDIKPVVGNQPIRPGGRQTVDSNNPLQKTMFQRIDISRRNTYNYVDSPVASPPMQIMSISSGENTPNSQNTPVATSPLESLFTVEEQEIIHKQIKEKDFPLHANSLKDSPWLIDG
jgi:hypothetical protein